MPDQIDRSVSDLVREISRTASYLYERGFGESFFGNISALLRGTSIRGGSNTFPLPTTYPDLEGSTLLITRTTSTMKGIASDPTSNVGTYRIESGRVRLANGGGPPSIEIGAHLAIHSRLSMPTSAIVHCHIGRLLPALERIDPLPGWIGVVPVLQEGSADLARLTGEAAAPDTVLVWRGHGIVAMAGTLVRSLELIDRAVALARSGPDQAVLRPLSS